MARCGGNRVKAGSRKGGRGSLAGEIGGACGDLGTLIPHALGAVTVAGMSSAGVLCGFGAFLVASGLHYGIPMAVQPMKAVSAIMLSGGLTPSEVAATGLVIGAALILLAITGLIRVLARLVPRSVVAGLQLGLGLSMAVLGIRLAAPDWGLGIGLALVVLALQRTRLPAALAVIGVAIAFAALSGQLAPAPAIAFAPALPGLTLPDLADVKAALLGGVLPQLPLTLANAIVLTAMIARDLYPLSSRASETRLAWTSGLANLALCPLGAMPMCHGAGGLAAQHRFGARSGLAPMLLGVVLLVAGAGFAGAAPGLLAMIPAAAIGVLLAYAGLDLALSRRLAQARPDCWPAIGAAAALTLLVDPAAGLAAGWAIEAGRGWAKSRRPAADA